MLKDPLKCFRSVSSYLLFNLISNGFVPLVSYCLYIITLAADTEYLGIWTLIFAFINTILAVLLLSIDRYVLVARPIMYPVIITKTRITFAVLFSWTVSMALAFGILVRVKTVVSQVAVFALLPFIVVVVFAIIVIDIETWRSISKAQTELQRLGNESRSDINSANYKAEQKRVQTEKRFAKVVVLLLMNVVLFILPQTLVVASRMVNVWCKSCLEGLQREKASLFQAYYFPLFYSTTPLLYLLFIPKYRKSFSVLVDCFKVSRRWEVPR